MILRRSFPNDTFQVEIKTAKKRRRTQGYGLSALVGGECICATSDENNSDIRYIVRVCPGQVLADAQFFMTIATILATLTISRVRDENGNEVIPDVEMMSGVIRFVAAANFSVTKFIKVFDQIAHCLERLSRGLGDILDNGGGIAYFAQSICLMGHRHCVRAHVDFRRTRWIPAFDHSRDLLHMINHFREEMPQPIVGVGHSMGAGQL